MLSDVRDNIIKEIEESGRELEMGTTKWFKTDNMTLESPGTPTDIVLKTANFFFLGQKKK